MKANNEITASPINLGTRDKTVKVSGFTLTETVRSPGSIIPPHYHNHTNISFVLPGSFIEAIKISEVIPFENVIAVGKSAKQRNVATTKGLRPMRSATLATGK